MYMPLYTDIPPILIMNHHDGHTLFIPCNLTMARLTWAGRPWLSLEFNQARAGLQGSPRVPSKETQQALLLGAFSNYWTSNGSLFFRFLGVNRNNFGWWFQTWLLLSISYMGCHPSHWRTHIFQRGRSTTNQLHVLKPRINQAQYTRSLYFRWRKA